MNFLSFYREIVFMTHFTCGGMISSLHMLNYAIVFFAAFSCLFSVSFSWKH